MLACGSSGSTSADAGPDTGVTKCNDGWLASCQTDADCWGAGYVCQWETTNQSAPKHCTTMCTADTDCTGYNSCPMYVTSHQSCVIQTGFCLYY